MRVIKAIVGMVLVVGLLLTAGFAFWGRGGVAVATSDPAQSGAAVPAAAPTMSLPTTTTVVATIPPPPTPRTSDPPVISGTGQIGSRAITPHVTPTMPGQATFTEEDVRAYLAADGLNLLIRVRPEGPYQIEQIKFLTYAEARTQDDIYVGVPEDRSLCLVLLRGVFKLTGPYIPGQGATVYTYTTMTLIFDGLSGNWLGERGRP